MTGLLAVSSALQVHVKEWRPFLIDIDKVAWCILTANTTESSSGSYQAKKPFLGVLLEIFIQGWGLTNRMLATRNTDVSLEKQRSLRIKFTASY